MSLLFQLNLDAGASDVTAPTLSSATLAANGASLSLLFSETVSVGVGGVTITPSGGAATLSYASGTGTNTLIYTVSRALSSTETATITYVQSGDGIGDASGNDLASFSGQAITNNSTVNSAPIDLLLSNTTVYTTGGLNATVGTLSATDADAGETFTYALVAGAGDTDNASFNIDGARLRCDDPGALGVSTRSIRIRVTDSASNTRDEVFEISVAVGGFAITGAATSNCTSSASSSI